MADIPKTPETAPIPTPDATTGTPTEAVAAPLAAEGAPAPPPGPSVADTARLLAERFPALFGAGVIKPIKLRIQADIHERAPGVFSKKALSLFLQRHTTATAYLRALVAEGATRTDLDGQPAGEIAAEHRDAAGAELERRRAIVEAKKQAAREAARAARQGGRQDAGPEQPAASSSRPDRAPRPPRPDPGPRRARPPQAGAPRGPGRRGNSHAEAPRRRHEPLPARKPNQAPEMDSSSASTLPLTPEQAAEAEARRQRALLLRSFEQSPLSKANFGALKGLSEEALDALLTRARQERGSR
ncbi:prop effector ProQ [Piscinibacter aquaticus]|uniref:Prop effector ProQ n=1 Tax=Piscinibacter aquaticus TaxID=392597 RepID=A0A5C6TNJ7_9BURK|nr:prop effector ProQ [Piscinibacter aquaticus]